MSGSKKFQFGKTAASITASQRISENVTTDGETYAPFDGTDLSFGAGADTLNIRLDPAVYFNDPTANVFQTGIFESEIDLGAGNNSLSISHNGFDNTNIFGIEGASPGTDSTIRAGAGADTLSIRGVETGVSYTDVNLGDGNNSLRIFADKEALHASSIETGKGADNVFLSGKLGDSFIDLGNGNNVLTARGQVDNTGIYTGSGADKINLRYVGEAGDADNFVLSGWSDIATGAGKDTVSLTGNAEVARIDLGTGNDALTLRGNADSVSVYARGGDNSITLSQAVMNSSLYIGTDESSKDYGGKNAVNLGLMRNSELYLGSGADTILVRDGMTGSRILAGDGKNAITVFGGLAASDAGSAITAGKDADTITIHGGVSVDPGYSGGLFPPNQIATGAGDDVVRVTATGTGESISGLGVAAGVGNDSIVLDGEVNDSTIDTGQGTDNLTLTGALSSSEILLGGGNNTLRLDSVSDSLIYAYELSSDKVYVNSVGSGTTVLLGDGNDSLYLGGMATWTTGGGTMASLDGGSGTDALVISGAAHNVTSLERLFKTGSGSSDLDIRNFEIIDMSNGVVGGLLLTEAGLNMFAAGDGNGELPANLTAKVNAGVLPQGLNSAADLKEALLDNGAMRIHGDTAKGKADTVYLEAGWIKVGTSVVDKITYDVYAKLGDDNAWDATDPMVLIRSGLTVLSPGDKGYLGGTPDVDKNGWLILPESADTYAYTDLTAQAHKVSGSAGNDSISLGEIQAGGGVKLGHGADTLDVNGNISGANGNRLNISGEGDNSVSVTGLTTFTNVSFGAGNNAYHSEHGIYDSELKFGDGRAEVGVNDGRLVVSKVTTGNGNDTLSVTYAYNSNAGSAVDTGTVKLGEGHNLVRINDTDALDAVGGNLSAAYNSSFETGSGNDTFTAFGRVGNSTLKLGAGQNLVEITTEDAYAMMNGSLTTGAGNDTASFIVKAGSSPGASTALTDVKLDFGDGDNSVTIANNDVGGGIATLYAAKKANIELKTGKGNDSLEITASDGYAAVSRMDLKDSGGDNHIKITGGTGLEMSNLNLGSGSDTVVIKKAAGAGTAAISFTAVQQDIIDTKLVPLGQGATIEGTNFHDVEGTGVLGGKIIIEGGDNVLSIDAANVGVMGSVQYDAKNDRDSIAAYAEVKLNGAKGTGTGDNDVDIHGGNFGLYAAKLSLGNGNDTVRISAGDASDTNPDRFAAAMAHSSLSINGGVNQVELRADAATGYAAYNSSLSLNGENTLAVVGANGLAHSKLEFKGKGEARLEIESENSGIFDSTVTAGGNLSAAIKAKYAIDDSSLTVTGKADLLLEAGEAGINGSTLSLNGTGNRLVVDSGYYGLEYSKITSKGGDTIDISGQGGGFYESTLSITGGNNLLRVDGGSDAAAANSSLSLGGGNDTVVLEGGRSALYDSRLSTGAGDDLIVLKGAVSGNYTVTSGTKTTVHDAIDAGAGNDTIRMDVSGGAFENGAVINGGAGLDVLSLSSGVDGVSVTLRNLFSGTTVKNVEILHLEASLNNLLLTAADLANFAPAQFSLPDKTKLTAMRITGDDGTGVSFDEPADAWSTNGQLYRMDGEYYYLFQSGATGASLLVSAAVGISGTFDNTGPDLLTIPNGAALNDMAEASGAEAIHRYGDTAQTLSISESNSGTALENTGLSFGKGADNISISGDMGMQGGYIDLGAGNNKLTVSSSAGVRVYDGIMGIPDGDTAVIRAGAGNDSLSVFAKNEAVANADIDLGNGANKVDITGTAALSESVLRTGSGKDTVSLSGHVTGGIIDLGDGDNRFTLNNGDFIAGTAANAIVAGSGADNIALTDATAWHGNLTIAAGEGKNTISIAGSMDRGNIQAGSGNDLLDVGDALFNSAVNLGNGNNTLNAGFMSGGSVTTGSGADRVNVGSLSDASITTGSGADQVSLGTGSNATISLGEGNDTLFLAGALSGSNNILHGDDDLSGAKAGTRDVLDFSTLADKVTSLSIILGGSATQVKGFEVINIKDGVAGGLMVSAEDLANFSGSAIPVAQLAKATAMNSKDAAANTALRAALDDAADSLVRIEGDTTKGKADTVYLSDVGAAWERVGTVTIDKVVYQVWSANGSIGRPGDGTQYVLIQNGLSVKPVELESSVTATANDEGTTWTMAQALSDSNYIGTTGSQQLYKITGSEGNDNILIDDQLDAKSSFALGSGHDTLYLAADLASGTITSGLTGDDSVSLGGGATGSTINLGGGDNILDAYRALEKSKLDMGAGNDELTVRENMLNSTVNLGAGDNRAYFSGNMEGGSLTTGAGDDVVVLHGQALRGAQITLGAGDDVVEINGDNAGLGGAAKIDGGAGTDTLHLANASIFDLAAVLGTGSATGMDVIELGQSDAVELRLSGDALGKITADKLSGTLCIADAAKIDGQSIVRIDGSSSDILSLAAGEGWTQMGSYMIDGSYYNLYQNMDGKKVLVNDDVGTVNGAGVSYETVGLPTEAAFNGDPSGVAWTLASLSGKTGAFSDNDDYLRVSGAVKTSTLNLGNGDNAVEVKGAFTSSVIEAGSGSDTFTLRGAVTKSDVILGEGDNSLALHGAVSGTNISAGDGHDTLRAWNTVAGSDIYLGSGDNTAEFAKNVSNSTISVGTGNDSLAFYGALSNSTLALGSGSDSLYAAGAVSTVDIMGLGTLEARIDGQLSASTISMYNTAADSLTLAGVSKSSIDLGNGNNFLDAGAVGNSTITMGNWNDFITAGAATNSTFTLGAGDDSVILASLGSGAVNLGEGNDFLQIGGAMSGGAMSGGTVDGGDGNDVLNVLGAMSGGTVSGGNGNDVLNISGAMNGGTVDMGAGNDNLNLHANMSKGTINMGAGDDSVYLAFMSGGVVNLGDGNDSLDILGNMSGGTLVAGSGINSVSITGNVSGVINMSEAAAGWDLRVGGTMTGSTSRLNLSEHNDTITIGGMLAGTLNAGGGDDSLYVYGNMSGGTVNMGDGDDSLYIYYGSMSGGTLNLGNGDDSLYIYGAMTKGTVNMGDGSDSVSITALTGGALNTNEGRDSVSIGTMDGGAVNLGTENDTLYIGNMSKGTVDAGTGDDSVTISAMGGGTVNLGAGNDTLNASGFHSGTANLGDGDDYLLMTTGTLSSGAVNMGAGDDYADIAFMNGGTVNMGDGDDYLQIGTALSQGTVNMGAGADIADIASMTGGTVNMDAGNDDASLTSMSGGILNMGAGDDYVNIAAMSNGTVNLGAGNDTLFLDGFTGGAIDGGAGQDILYLGMSGKTMAEFDSGEGFAGVLNKGSLKGFESLVLDLQDSMAGSLTITAADIARLTAVQGGTDLYVRGDDGTFGQDTVNLSSSFHKQVNELPGSENTRTVDNVSYQKYSDGSDIIWIQQDLLVSFGG